MDFFVIQDRARSRAGGLFTLVYFSACGAIAAVHFLVMVLSGRSLSSWQENAEILVWTAPILAAVFIVGVIVRFYAIRYGGGGIARELGGRRLHPGSEDPVERRVLNLVEELAVAFGLPLPEVWLLERESGINAFVAGDEPARAVLGVTRGAIERLSEDELRAVLAHEFSHVVTGHMRLNFQLLAWVQGLLFFGVVGRMLFRGAEGSSRRWARSRPGGVDLQTLPVVGVILIALGSVFSLFGRFVQGVICRDQELVADRAASELLQSRLPLLRALRKIGGMRHGGALSAPTAVETAHLFFCQAVEGITAAAFPTHPLISDRIRALDPDWDGEYLSSEVRGMSPEEFEGAGEGEESGKAPGGPASEEAPEMVREYARGLLPVGQEAVFPAKEMGGLGEVWNWGRVEQGREDRAGLREEWVRLTLSREGVQRLMLEICRSGPGVLDSPLKGASPAQRMLLFDLAMPLLRRMPLEEFVSLNRKIRRETRRGEELDLIRYLFAHVFARRMQICLGLREMPGVVFEEFSSLWGEAQTLVSLMSREGAPSKGARSAAYAAAWTWLGLEMPPFQEKVSMFELGQTLDNCAQASPLLKKKLLAACGIAAGYEGQIQEREMVILRLCAAALGTPVPNLRSA